MYMSKVKKCMLITAIVVVITAIVMFCSGFTTAHAEELPGETEQITTVETTEKAPPETIFTRTEEWFKNNFLEFLSTVNFGSILACIVVAIIEKKGNKKNAKLTIEKLGVNTESNGEVVRAVNSLIDNYNSTLEKLNEIETGNQKRDAICKELEVFMKAILEILTTVYANNKNIPQAVKDLISLKYVTALKDNSINQEELPTEVKTETEEV